MVSQASAYEFLGTSSEAKPTHEGTDQQQTLTIDAEGGDFTLALGEEVSDPIAWSGTNETLLGNVLAALEALVGEDNVEVAEGTITSGVGTLVITFVGGLAATDVALLVADGAELTGSGAGASVAITRPSYPAGKVSTGATFIETDSGEYHRYTGTAWVEVTPLARAPD